VKVKILPTALEDLDRGRRFYARQRKSLGEYFLDALFSDIDSLELYAGIHIKVFDFHRLLAKRFPYAVYYRVEGETCTVFRVLDCRQEPEKAAEELK
jgi:plasmid stabilization system protein ParE